VREAAAGDTLWPGVALVAPGGLHLVFDAGGAARLTDEPPVHGVRPSVDVTLASADRCTGRESWPCC
jgi:two-component system chemotaxis response regulator CheB